MPHKQKTPHGCAVFFVCLIVLDLADVDGVWALWALTDFKGNLVPFLELVERNVLEFVGVEEKILV